MNWLIKISFNTEVARLLKEANLGQDKIHERMNLIRERKLRNLIGKAEENDGTVTIAPMSGPKVPTISSTYIPKPTKDGTFKSPKTGLTRKQLLKNVDLNVISDKIEKFEGNAPDSLSVRNNNPGNLKFMNQPGAVKGDKDFAKFTDYKTGKNALMNQIKLDASRGHTVESFIYKYAPPSDNNPTDKYVDFVTDNS